MFAAEESPNGGDSFEFIRGSNLGVGNGGRQSVGCIHNAIGLCDCRRQQGVMVEFECVGDALPPSVCHDCFDASIVVQCGRNVPAAHGVVAPRSASVGLVVDKDLRAGWCHGCGIEGV